jgi:uncharacterized protein YdbL (DUF1318 family)
MFTDSEGGSARALPASAGELQDALSAKKVCEGQDGFLQTTPGNEDMAGYVSTVNAKRNGVYTDIATSRGISVEAVALEHVKEQKPQNLCK